MPQHERLEVYNHEQVSLAWVYFHGSVTFATQQFYNILRLLTLVELTKLLQKTICLFSFSSFMKIHYQS